MFKLKKTIKGKKVWGITTEEGFRKCDDPICTDDDIDKVISRMDSNYTILVEMEVTKAYKRNPEFVEIEL